MQSLVFDWIEQEEKRQKRNIELIASENFVSEDIKRAVGSCLTNKYCEGYPDRLRTGNRGRYYGGCQVIDSIEQYCCDKWLEVFAPKSQGYHVNVQPHCGSSANMAAFAAVLQPGDTILSMSLENGAHLTHGSPVSFSGKLYNMVFYNVDENGYIDMEDVYNKIVEYKPKLVLAGASAYSREIDFKAFAEVMDRANSTAYFMVDMAHIAGLVAAGLHQSPFGLADLITTTTHKTLRGPRGGLIFSTLDLAKKVDSAVFPYCQGGPLEHVIAGKAICAEEACTAEYKQYMKQVQLNAKAMADQFTAMGYKVVTGGTDNHMFLIDLRQNFPDVTGHQIQEMLDTQLITLNKNCVPNETRSPKEASGVRIGTPAMTTKGWKERDFIECAKKIDKLMCDCFKDTNS